ncbi:hypothetical protein DFP72DRAFT_888419 [Ephemerocybe angulata]|uniref:Uncharacterized protein n=1 Tax=Ephemerocybe angulata TaxID=980116 RepID=A0A8H6M9V4_9AGAR|nr:hypothetical protein DFP72DRAFT_888419 [Tulosesus angulatus]
MSDSESSASSSSSRSPSPVATKIKPKGSKNAKSNGKNEGTDPSWEFKPPPGRVLLEDTFDAGDFDWDNVKNNEDLELVVIRVPDGVKAKYLEGAKIADVSSTKSMKVGTVKRKHATFDVWSVGSERADDSPVAGEEIRSLSCLLPRKKKKGKLYPAPKGIARHLVLAAQPVVPTAPESILPKNESTGKYQNPPRQSYTEDWLTHSFAPIGSHTTVPASEDDKMELEYPPEEQVVPSPKKSKSKKRKGASAENVEDAPAPKKVKKSKASA